MMKKHIKPIFMVFALVLVVAFQSIDQNLPSAGTKTTRATTDVFAENVPPHGGTFHCLVYGKYCLSDALRSR
ncbi:hypothetical protein QFZ91_006134 [Paraburkholderia sp. JPY419]